MIYRQLYPSLKSVFEEYSSPCWHAIFFQVYYLYFFLFFLIYSVMGVGVLWLDFWVLGFQLMGFGVFGVGPFGVFLGLKFSI